MQQNRFESGIKKSPKPLEMKKILIASCLCLFLATATKAQVDSTKIKPVKNETEKMLLISKRQNTIGWVLLSTGLVAAGTGLLIKTGNTSFDKGFDLVILKTILLTVGTGLTIASIPVLIVSGIKKRKAYLLLDAGRVQITPQFKTNDWQYRAGIAINF